MSEIVDLAFLRAALLAVYDGEEMAEDTMLDAEAALAELEAARATVAAQAQELADARRALDLARGIEWPGGAT